MPASPTPPVANAVFQLSLPPWVAGWLSAWTKPLEGLEDRMRLALELGQLNLANRTGGPFGAAIFDLDTHQLIAVGMNLVVGTRCSVSHAEMVATVFAQQALGSHDLGAPGLPRCELVTSTEPCAMCLGAIPWSGVRQVVCGARDEDARKIGFDEGPKIASWVAELERRQIHVIRDVLRAPCADLLNAYACAGGALYNGRASDT